MPRVREVPMDGMSLSVSPFSFDDTEKYMKARQEMQNRDPKPTAEDWIMRVLETVCFSLNKASGKEVWTPTKLKAELDTVYILKLHSEILEMSGIRTLEPGEAQATPTLG